LKRPSEILSFCHGTFVDNPKQNHDLMEKSKFTPVGLSQLAGFFAFALLTFLGLPQAFAQDCPTPSNVDVSYNCDGVVVLDWDITDPDNLVQSYDVDIENGNQPVLDFVNMQSTQLTIVAGILTPGTTYNYAITANCAASNVSSATGQIEGADIQNRQPTISITNVNNPVCPGDEFSGSFEVTVSDDGCSATYNISVGGTTYFNIPAGFPITFAGLNAAVGGTVYAVNLSLASAGGCQFNTDQWGCVSSVFAKQTLTPSDSQAPSVDVTAAGGVDLGSGATLTYTPPGGECGVPLLWSVFPSDDCNSPSEIELEITIENDLEPAINPTVSFTQDVIDTAYALNIFAATGTNTVAISAADANGNNTMLTYTIEVEDNNGCNPCSDGVQNGDETGIDCGGVICAPCTDFIPFITTWKTDNPGVSCSSCITIPTTGGGYNYDVDWENDGVYDDFAVSDEITHDYGAPGTYQVAIRGAFPRIYFNNQGDKEKILSVDQWGDVSWVNMNSAFRGCINLTVQADDVPDLYNVKDMNWMFSGASSFNQDVAGWDVSSVNSMRAMFSKAESFNQDIGGWDVSSVTNMAAMFRDTDSFNQDIDGWDVSNVVNMRHMFFRAHFFNQDIGGWDVSNVTKMKGMLSSSGLSRVNYNSTLIGWANQSVQDSVYLGAATLKYCTAENARNMLINDHNWVISGDGLDCSGCNLTCNGSNPNFPLNIPVNGDCNVELSFLDVVEIPIICPGDKILTVRDTMNSIIVSDTNLVLFDPAPYTNLSIFGPPPFEGQVLSVTVTDVTTGIFCNSFIRAVDIRPPVISCVNDTISCIADTSAVVLGAPAVSDNCSDDISLSYFDNFTNFTCANDNKAILERVWSAADEQGNTSSCSQFILLERPNLNTDIEFPLDTLLSCEVGDPTVDMTGQPELFGIIIENTNECGLNVTFNDDTLNLFCNAEYQIQRTWTVTESCSGIMVTDLQLITVVDTVAPLINLQGDSIFSAFGIETCSDNVISSFEVSSNCGDEPEVSIFFDSLRLGSLKPLPQVLTGNYPNFGISGVFPIGAHALEIHAVDACGNETIEIVPFVVERPIENSDICPSVISVEAQNDGAALTAEALILDSFFNNSCLDWSATLDQDVFTTCSDIGTEDVELSITNSVDTFVCVSTVLISDNTSPAISCSDTTITIIDGAQKTVTRDLLQASLTDNCTLTDTIILPGKLSCTDIGDNEVVILAQDASGNIGMCTATVTVINEEVPLARCRDREVSLNQEGMASLTALDIDDGSYSNCGTLSYTASQLSFSCEDGSVQTVALYVEGENGKADTCTSNLTLKDVYAPNAQCADITVYLGANGQVAIPPASLDGGSEDNCDITDWDSTFPMADCDEVGTHFALLLVSDAAGNTDVCISEITVADTLGSLLTAAITDTTVVLNASCEAVVPDLTGTVMVSGGCSADLGGLSIGQFPTAGTAIPEDTTVVSLFIEGSTADSLEITLSVAPDTIAPELSIYTPWGSLLQQDTLRVSTLDTSCATVTTFELVPSDNCPSADTFAITAVLTDSLSDASPDFGVVYDADNEQYRFELSAEDGWYAFDFSVTDAFGNAGTASLIVLVQDSIPPVAVCEDAEVSVTPTQGSSISFADIGIGSTDNCGLMDITLSQTQFTCADAGPQPVVLTLTDQFGNSSECTATVTVVNALQGLPCDDGDDCTINDRYLIDCGCAGDLLDTNDNGLCDLDEGCIEPTNLAAEVDSPTSGTFSWSAVPQAQSYRFQYRPIGGDGVSIDVTENEVPLTGLPQGSTIQWRVRALCDGENSAFVIGPALNLAVPGTTWTELSGGDEEYQNFSTPVQEASGNPFKLFPNPVRDKAYLVFEQPFSGVVTVSSVLGQQLYRITADSQKQLELDLSDWKSSHQLLLITVADGHSAPVTKRVLVAR
jgi:surface protein